MSTIRCLSFRARLAAERSEIGLHRIAYLLSPFSELGDRAKPTPDSILFLGPSRSFLEYASDILPQLGVEEACTANDFW